MNREIKFRGLTDNPDGSTHFEYGCLSHDLPNTTSYYDTHSYRICWHPESGGQANKPVINGTVGQFTGLKDFSHDERDPEAEGTDIYEGDVVIDFAGDYREVIFAEDVLAWYAGDDLLSEISRPVIVGNIHQNPELVKA